MGRIIGHWQIQYRKNSYLHVKRLSVLDSARVTPVRCGVGQPRVAPPWRASGAKGSVGLRSGFVETVSRMSECGTVEHVEHTREHQRDTHARVLPRWSARVGVHSAVLAHLLHEGGGPRIPALQKLKYYRYS